MIDHTGVTVGAFAAGKAFCGAAPGAIGYHPNYHGAFAHDPDGHDIEAVCHDPEDPS